MQNPVYLYNNALPTAPPANVAAPVPIYLSARPWQTAYVNPSIPPSPFNFNALIPSSKSDERSTPGPTVVPQHPINAGYGPANPVPIRFYDPNIGQLAQQSNASTKSIASDKAESKNSSHSIDKNRSAPASGQWKSGKNKRVRTIFTPEQLSRLEKEFEQQQYMVGAQRLYLANTLKLSEAQVKVWFQNRRIKWRKDQIKRRHFTSNNNHSSGSISNCSSNDSDEK